MASDPDNPMEYMATAFNGRDLETGSIFSEDESDSEEQERWRKRFKRRVTVHPFLQCCPVAPPGIEWAPFHLVPLAIHDRA
jgi:hypothetical protein